jgi:hypothetical protein
MDGSDRVPDPHGLRASLWLEQHFFIESEMALFSECRLKCAQNLVDRADIVREGDLSPMYKRTPLGGRYFGLKAGSIPE